MHVATGPGRGMKVSLLGQIPLVAALTLAGVPWAHAELGGSPAPIAGDRSSTTGVTQRSMPGYSIRETTLPGTTRIREYLDATGTVVAVTWSGPFMPDLRLLLGPHFATLDDERTARPRAGRGLITINRSDVVIESGGHMRAWYGRAWLPGRLPAGLTPDAIE